MKKIFVLIVFIVFCINTAFANNKDYTVNFNGNKFHLLYSVKDKDFGGYLNEYYKKGETYNIWTEMVAVHHFPNAYSPIDRIKDFKDYLIAMKVPSSLSFDDKKNTAIIDFIMISDHSMPIVIEFNIFKYEKSKKCGSIAIQYTKRYTATTTMQIEEIKKDIEKKRTKLIKKIKKFEIPEIITNNIDKCISANNIIEKNKKENSAENITEQTQTEEQNNTDNDIATEIAENKPATEENISEETTGEENIVPVASTNINDENNENAAKIKAEENSKENEVIEAAEEKSDTKSKEDKKPESLTVMAPTYEDNSSYSKNISKKKSKNNKITKEQYEISNDKDEFIAKARTKKELKAEIKDKKQKQKDAKKQAKIQAKITKKELKQQAKRERKQEKNIKKEAKKAAKAAKKPYTVSNNNSDLIAKPRTKKELKKSNKQNKQKAKNKKKEAKKKKKSA